MTDLGAVADRIFGLVCALREFDDEAAIVASIGGGQWLSSGDRSAVKKKALIGYGAAGSALLFFGEYLEQEFVVDRHFYRAPY